MPSFLLIRVLTLLRSSVTFLLNAWFGARIVLPLTRQVHSKKELCRNLQPLCATRPRSPLLELLMIRSGKGPGRNAAPRKEEWYFLALQLPSLRLHCNGHRAWLA